MAASAQSPQSPSSALSVAAEAKGAIRHPSHSVLHAHTHTYTDTDTTPHTHSAMNPELGQAAQKPQDENWNSSESWTSQGLVWKLSCSKEMLQLIIPRVSQHEAHGKKKTTQCCKQWPLVVWWATVTAAFWFQLLIVSTQKWSELLVFSCFHKATTVHVSWKRYFAKLFSTDDTLDSYKHCRTERYF